MSSRNMLNLLTVIPLFFWVYVDRCIIMSCTHSARSIKILKIIKYKTANSYFIGNVYRLFGLISFYKYGIICKIINLLIIEVFI